MKTSAKISLSTLKPAAIVSFLLIMAAFIPLNSIAQDILSIVAVVEIPAGTNVKWEYDYEEQEMTAIQSNGVERVINYLPYPGNYGFLKGTYQDPEKGGDGDALDVIIISQSVERGTTLSIIPIAVLELIDSGEKDDKIIAIPADPDLRMVDASSLEELNRTYPGIIEIIETWFLNYKGPGVMKISNTGDEKRALEIIRKNSVQ